MHSLAAMVGRSALVLKEFKIDYSGPEFVHIVARRAGLVAFFLTVFGVDVTTTFDVYADRIEFKEGSLSGTVQTVMPLRSISIATTGYTKPFSLVGLGFLFLFAAPVTFGISIIFAILCFIFYFLRKSLLIHIISNSGWPVGICFKRSVIEGVRIEVDQAREVINIVNQLMMAEASK